MWLCCRSSSSSSVSAQRSFFRTLALHSPSCQEFGRGALRESAGDQDVTSSRDADEHAQPNSGRRFSRALGPVDRPRAGEGSARPHSNFEKQRVPPATSFPRAPANVPFRDEEDEPGRRNVGDQSRVRGGENLHRGDTKQNLQQRSAFSEREEPRKQEYQSRIREQQQEQWRSSKEDIRRDSGVDGSRRRLSGARETLDEIRPVQRDRDEDAVFDRTSRERPHYGYRLKRDGPEIGEFRRLDGPSLSSRIFGEDCEEEEETWPRSRLRESREPRRDRGGSDSEQEFEGRDSSPQSMDDEMRPRSPGFPRRQEGEKKWQYAVRKKQQLAGWNRGKVNKSPQTTFVDDEELGNVAQGDEWRSKKLEWLCRELVGLKPRGVVTILNEQRPWIKGDDVKYIVEHLLKMHQFLRAHRVLKWEMQQPFYEYNFELNTQVANALGENNKLSRTRDIYDLMIQNGQVPELSTYVLLINCFLEEGTNEALQKGSYLFSQMMQLGGHEPPASLRFKVFKALVQKNLTHIGQADEVFDGIRAAGLVATEEMYNQLVLLHGTSGNQSRVDSLTKEMKDLGMKIGDEVYSAAVIKACVKDGDVAKAEEAFSELKKVWLKPIPSVYAALIKLYGKSGLPDKAFESFQEIKQSGISININVYEAMIEVSAAAGNREQAEQLVEEAEARGLEYMQGCYNALIRMYSELGELEKLEKVFQEMPSKRHHPRIASYNALLEAYVTHGLVEKAEALYEVVKKEKRINANPKTYELVIKAYGEQGDSVKLNAVFKEMAANKMGVPKGQAADILKVALSPKEITALKNSKLKLHKNQREVLAGVLLGGARVESHDKNRTYELHFELDPDHQVGALLLKHLYQLFADWSVEGPKERLSDDPKRLSQTKKVLSFRTVSHGSFRFFAHQYRPDGKPKIPRLIHRWLSPQTLAYWYMYGGKRCAQTGGIILNASAYSSKELTLVVDALKAKTIECERRQSKDEQSLLVTGKSALWLWKLMQPFIVDGAKDFLEPEDKR
ncbi:hypothetical protein Mapa_010843 [Marchantia paleacea]|nr:hypothetical protein Mapa_010843 [Marchantia paleacea]